MTINGNTNGYLLDVRRTVGMPKKPLLLIPSGKHRIGTIAQTAGPHVYLIDIEQSGGKDNEPGILRKL